jgi:hypothetical protein
MIEPQGSILAEEDMLAIDQWKRGQELRNIGSEGWQIIFDTLERYADVANDDLLRMTPGDPNVMTAHAAASAVRQVSSLFKDDVTSAIAASYDMPDALKSTLKASQQI